VFGNLPREDDGFMIKRQSLAHVADFGWIVAIAVASSLLMYSGWQEQGPFDSPDTLAHQANAVDLLRQGVIPYRGQGLSYSGWGPPGTSFLMLPGVVLMQDPRLAEVPGAFLLHLGTLLFLFLIVRGALGRGAAWAAVALAGMLPITGPTLWPNGHPFFILGMLYFLIRWVRDRSQHAFSAALLLAGLGMYVYFTIAPALIAMALIALLYRRPVSWRSLAATTAFLLVVWFPYLRFESGRGFIDIGIMTLRKDFTVSQAQPSTPVYCYASLPGETDFNNFVYLPWTGTSDPGRVIYPGMGRISQFELQLCTLLNKSDRNFDSGYFLFGDPAWPTGVLYGVSLTGFWVLLFAGWGGMKRISDGWLRLRAIPAWKFLLACGMGTAAIFLLVRPEVIGTLLVGDPDWNQPARLLLTQIRAYGILLWNSIWIGLLLAGRWEPAPQGTGVLTAMIGCCGFLLVALSEIERSWRFWWFWPLQCIAIVAAVEGLNRFWKSPRWVTIVGWILAIGLFIPYGSIAGTMDSILRYGYGGRESGQMQALQWLTEEARKDPDKPISIGAMRYRGESDITLAWGWLEFGLKYIHTVPNATAGDLSPQNNYRVVEFLGADQDHHPVGCPWGGYDLVWESRRYAICARQP
jgi:hypothetical protein